MIDASLRFYWLLGQSRLADRSGGNMLAVKLASVDFICVPRNLVRGGTTWLAECSRDSVVGEMKVWEVCDADGEEGFEGKGKDAGICS